MSQCVYLPNERKAYGIERDFRSGRIFPTHYYYYYCTLKCAVKFIIIYLIRGTLQKRVDRVERVDSRFHLLSRLRRTTLEASSHPSCQGHKIHFGSKGRYPIPYTCFFFNKINIYLHFLKKNRYIHHFERLIDYHQTLGSFSIYLIHSNFEQSSVADVAVGTAKHSWILRSF